MVPECRTMEEVRERIDALDREIIALLARRGEYVRQAARLKHGPSEIRDDARIEEVVAKVRREGVACGLDANLAERVYRTMIEGFIALEAAEHERLRAPRRG